MSIRKTLVITLILVVLMMIYVWDQQRLFEGRAEETLKMRLTDLVEGQVREIRCFVGNEKIILRKTDDQWMVVHPVTCRADGIKVQRMIRGLIRSRRESAFDVETNRYVDFGVTESGRRIEYIGRDEQGDEVTTRLFLGLPTPLGEDHYVRIGQNIFLMKSKLYNFLSPDLLGIRDRRTLDANLTQATGVWLSWGPDMIGAGKKGDRWRLFQPIEFDADQEALATMLRAWDRSRGADYQDQDDIRLEDYGLSKPHWAGTVEVWDDETTRQLTMYIGDGVTTGSKPNRYWAKRSNDPVVFSIPARLVYQLMPSTDEFMSKSVVTVPLQKIQKVEFNLRGAVVTIVRDLTGVWRLMDEPAIALDQKVVGDTLQILAMLEAMSYLGDDIELEENTGLNKPTLVVTIHSEDGGGPQIIATGKKNPLEDYVYARRMDSGVSFGIDWKIPGSLFMTRDKFLDRSIFTFSHEVVYKIVILDNDGRRVEFFRGGGGSWKFKASTNTSIGRVSASRMTDLILVIAGLEWTEELYTDDSKDIVIIRSKGLETPKRSIQMFDEDGVSVARLDLAPGSSDNRAFIRVDENHFYSVKTFRMISVMESLIRLGREIGQTIE